MTANKASESLKSGKRSKSEKNRDGGKVYTLSPSLSDDTVYALS